MPRQASADRYRDGQLFVDLHGHTSGHAPLSADAALDVLLRAVGVPDEAIPQGLDEKASRWRAQVAGKRVLVVLDNAVDSAQVRPLLPGTAGCLVLVTSRRRLVGLDGVQTVSLEVLTEHDAINLLAASVPGGRVAAEPQAAAEVAGLCGYLPLAIVIVASRLRHRPSWTPAYLAEMLRDKRRRACVLTVDGQSVGAAFALSHRYLTTAQRRMLRLIDRHAGPEIGIPAAAEYADLPVAEAERLLEELVDAHFLLQHGPGRYAFHDLLRDHAYPEADHAVRHLLDRYEHATALVAEVAREFNQLLAAQRTAGVSQ